MSLLTLTDHYRFINTMTISGAGGIVSPVKPPIASPTYQVSAGLLPTMQTSPLPQQPIGFLLDKLIGMFFCLLCKKGFAVVSTHYPLLYSGPVKPFRYSDS